MAQQIIQVDSYKPPPPPVVKSCYNCENYHAYREEESWEMPHIFWYVYVCDVKPTVVNLKQFPFRNTTCTKHELKKVANK
jgi:hypothetical protein